METQVNIHQLNQLIDYIKKTHIVFGTQFKNGKRVFDILDSSSDLKLGIKKPIIAFRDILFQNLLELEGSSLVIPALPPVIPVLPSVIPVKTGIQDSKISVDSRLRGNDKVGGRNNKIALIGLNNCDVWSLHYLLEEFDDTNILPKRDDIFIFASECLPNQYCFCGLMGKNKIAPFDLFVQEEKNGYAIFSGSKTGEMMLKKIGIKEANNKLEINKIQPDEVPMPEKKLSDKVSEKEKYHNFWRKISQNCFGCGACSMVCPLCFCTRKNIKNELTGQSKRCMSWDSCFASGFSQIQNHHDFRPKNVDRLYNWYHHKFVRSYAKSDRFLCTGCGRCIDACPAQLNTKNILESILKQNDNDKGQEKLINY